MILKLECLFDPNIFILFYIRKAILTQTNPKKNTPYSGVFSPTINSSPTFFQQSGAGECDQAAQLREPVPGHRPSPLLRQGGGCARAAHRLPLAPPRAVLAPLLRLQPAAGARRGRRVRPLLLAPPPLTRPRQSPRQEQNVQARVHSQHAQRPAPPQRRLLRPFVRQRLPEWQYCLRFQSAPRALACR